MVVFFASGRGRVVLCKWEGLCSGRGRVVFFLQAVGVG